MSRVFIVLITLALLPGCAWFGQPTAIDGEADFDLENTNVYQGFKIEIGAKHVNFEEFVKRYESVFNPGANENFDITALEKARMGTVEILPGLYTRINSLPSVIKAESHGLYIHETLSVEEEHITNALVIRSKDHERILSGKITGAAERFGDVVQMQRPVGTELMVPKDSVSAVRCIFMGIEEDRYRIACNKDSLARGGDLFTYEGFDGELF